jgi:hypothetical protein
VAVWRDETQAGEIAILTPCTDFSVVGAGLPRKCSCTENNAVSAALMAAAFFDSPHDIVPRNTRGFFFR